MPPRFWRPYGVTKLPFGDRIESHIYALVEPKWEVNNDERSKPTGSHGSRTGSP
ncbi:hypothetical protein ACVW1C_002569 [Bradyrhizobium sp. USDA 4011]